MVVKIDSHKGAKSAKGHTTKQKVTSGTGGPPKEPEVEYFDWLWPMGGGPTCNVNVNLGARIGLPDYSDVRFGASLTVPANPNEQSVDEAYEFAKEWVEGKMEALREELLDE